MASGGQWTPRAAARELRLPPAADEALVKKRYRELAKALHPDMDGGDEVRFREVTTAYRALQESPPPESQAPEDRQGPAMHARWRASRRHTPSEFPAWFNPTGTGQRREYHPGLLHFRSVRLASHPLFAVSLCARAVLRR